MEWPLHGLRQVERDCGGARAYRKHCETSRFHVGSYVEISTARLPIRDARYPSLRIEFENGDSLVISPLGDEDKREALVKSEEVETGLDHADRTKESLSHGLINPCVA
jgi:hypothetical protein